MKSILKTLSAVALTSVMVLPVLADDATATTDAKDQKDLKKVIEDQGINYVETAQKGITLSGYVDVSYTNQFAGRGQSFNGSSTVNDVSGQTQHTLRQFDTNANGFNVQAVKIALEKALPDKNEWAAGFRIDTILGQDATSLGDSAFGSSSDVALEQALVKFRIPIGNGLDIYAGKFVTFLGYEVIESPANLNFSRGLLFTNAIPLTHTGVYADYKFNDTVEAKFGVVDGWNNSTSTVSSDPAASYAFGGKAITGQVNVTAPGKNANICTSFIYSPDSTEPAGVNSGGDNGPSAVFDIWGNWNPTFVKDSALTLGFNIDFGYSGAAGFPSGSGPEFQDSNTWWGIALYSSYKFNKVFTLSGRAEYLHSDTSFAGPKFGNGINPDTFFPADEDAYSFTLTASFNIWDNLLTRAEYRIDDLSGNITGTNNTIENEVSLEAVYSF
jgi:Putative beta-barrel porin-2, OmpL-like. bbp2